MKYDLHSHSHFSDGALSPKDLLSAAVERGITHFALTDHDTVSGLSEAQKAAVDLPIELINGVELSCTWEKQLIHIVALNLNPDDELLRQGIAQNRQRRMSRAESMFEDFEQHEIYLRESVAEQTQSRGVPTRPHFAHALVEQGYAKDKKQAFKRYLVRGKPGYIPMRWPSVQEIGSWVENAGGVAVLAHPMRYNLTRTKLIRLIGEMKAAAISGIEVSTPSTDKQQMELLGQLCKQFNLLASIGSDFHSYDQTWARLGSARALPKELTPVWTRF